MAQSKPVNGEADTPRCTKTTLQTYMQRSGITPGMPAPERMEKLHTLFRMLAKSTHAISDNLQPGELQRRLRDTSILCDQSQMETLLEENMHAVQLLGDCVDEMRACPLSRVNGTSVAFAECVAAYEREAIRLEHGKAELLDLLEERGPARALTLQ